MAINPSHHGRKNDVDLDLCDVCYWRKRAENPIEKQDFIKAMMQFAHDAWGGDDIPSTEKSFAEVFDCVIVELLKQAGVYKMNQIEKACKNCRFFNSPSGIPECHKKPPKIIKTGVCSSGTEHRYSSVFPTVNINDFCGKFKPIKRDNLC